ncbi:MAG: glycosyltransferase family 4 protein [Candidatus Kaiserbacteria bacterium]|nr:glycosyltransferase family 4 protein [Candidatus Kaiserbacteria bacterium]
MRLYYVANFRMPSERAHGIQVAKMCEALIEAGADLTLIVPRRKTDMRSLREFYGLRVDVPKQVLFAFDWYTKGRILYYISSFSFMISSFFFLWGKRHEKGSVIYTIDADNWSHTHLSLVPLPYFSEMHGSKPRTLINKLFFRHISGVITINRLIRESLLNLFSISPERIIVEHDAVDTSRFVPLPRADARDRLGISHDRKLILYVGRILAWKGLEILPEAARAVGDTITLGIVGGTREQFVKVTALSDIPENIIFYGEKDFSEMPIWIAAADAVLLTSTARNETSYRWTSPMKAFEYMACGATIIAADAPAIREIVSTKNAYLYQPDDANSLAQRIRIVLENPREAKQRGEVALLASKSCSWRGRADRVLQFMGHITQ